MTDEVPRKRRRRRNAKPPIRESDRVYTAKPHGVSFVSPTGTGFAYSDGCYWRRGEKSKR